VKQSECRDAARIGDDRLAVQDQLVCREVRERIGDSLKAERPVVAPPCIHGGLSVVQVRLLAVAVELDLVNPASASRSLLAQRRTAGFDEAGDGAGLAPGTTLG
jgi:hypothetical protein